MVDQSQPTTRHMTLDAFKALPETNQPHELIHGELIVSPAPKPHHQRLVLRIVNAVQDSMSEGEVFVSPLDVYIDGHALQPDVVWIAPNSQCVIGADGYHEGPPDLVVEIVSPTSRRRDRADKYDIYEQAGVREYWIVEPESQFIEVYVSENQKFSRQGVYAHGTQFQSPTLNAAIDVSRIFPAAP